MRLSSVSLTNFRSFDQEEIFFSPNITILVGENNGGKSNAIDAIRLLTTPLGGRREIYCESTDVRFGSGHRKFEIRGTFNALSPGQQGRLISVIGDQEMSTAVFGLTYDETKGVLPAQPSFWGGQFKGAPEAGCREMVRHVYLPPLRDAKRALASGNPTRIHALLQHFLGEEDEDELVQRLKRGSSEEVLSRVDGAVAANLKSLSSGVRPQASSLGFATDETLVDIARDLRFKLADHGVEPEDLRYSGHGYANLLYMATIAVELEKTRAADLTLFLVDEPEAHLHPQLQAAVLSFLEEQAEKSSKRESTGPAGHLQVVVATHSPNLSAWVKCENVVVFKSLHAIAAAQSASIDNRGDEVSSAEEESSAAANASPPVAPKRRGSTIARRFTRCVSLARLGIDGENFRKIDRYLDVTKSAFLFGGRTLLVEGIAEAMLIPVFAKRFVFRDSEESLRAFKSTVFVPIDGVDFEPYARLLLSEIDGVRIADRLVVLTDGDANKVPAGSQIPGQQRKTKLEAIASRASAGSVLSVFINDYSLESELVSAGNEQAMRKVYLTLHPRSEDKWNAAIAKTGAEQAAEIQNLFKDTRKGEFAQILAEHLELEESSNFKVPTYIQDAIKALVQ